MVVMIHNKRNRLAKKRPHPVEVEENIDDDPKKTVPKEILVIAQEVKIVQSLACNDIHKRNRQLRKLRKWLQLRAQSSFSFTEDDFLRIWKGLYYNMWMADKPLVQEDLAEQLGQLLESFNGNVKLSVHFFGAFLRTMCNEWFGIDQWRLDKFMMLTRRMLRYMLGVLKNAKWSEQSVNIFNKHLKQTILAADVSTDGLTLHVLDIFFEELAKVSEGHITEDQVSLFVKPFVEFLVTTRNLKLRSHCRSRVFYHLLYQSALGREYSEKYNAWKEMGFPTENIDDLEKDEEALEEQDADNEKDQDEQNIKKHKNQLDPRAGNVDVFMPELPLDGKPIIKELELLYYKRDFNTKTRKMLRALIDLFQNYQNGVFPLGVKKMPRAESMVGKSTVEDKAMQLEKLENQLYGTSRKLKLMNKRQRRKLLNVIDLDDVDESNYEDKIEKALPKDYILEKAKRSKRVLVNGWIEEELGVSDNEAAVAAKKPKLKPAKQNKDLKDKKNANEKLEKPIKKSETTNEDEPAKKTRKLTTVDEKPKTADATVSTKPTVEDASKSATDKIETIPTTNGPTTSSAATSQWETPLEEGEVEYFIPSRKLQLKKANSQLVINPLAKKAASLLRGKSTTPTSSPRTPRPSTSVKRVKIMLKHNTEQKPSEYIRQIKNSPQLPFDADRKPGKGLLKPNSTPSPINPFYKKRLGLRYMNDTL